MNRIVQTALRMIHEARRRKVFRTGALYVLGAWLTLQVADVLFPGFGIPDAAIQALVWAAILGFPVALVFGWLFEIGAGGIRRTGPAAADAAEVPRPLAWRDYLILAAFAVVAAVLVARAVQEVRETPLDESSAATSATARASGERLPNSIAVLPFVNISNDPDNDYFCDGISEEILNALSHFRELNIIGRTSSFAFKGSDVGIDRISAVLGVGHVLQGSVRKAGNRLRISAQLLDHTGRQLWSQTFDRELANVFEIQEEIAQAVAATAASRVVSRQAAAYHPNLEAYDHFLAGRELLHRRDLIAARRELQRAIDLDPAFAEARAEWAIARAIGAPTADDLDAARAAIERALELQPKLLRAQAARGLLLTQSRPPDVKGAETVLRAVLEQDPNMSDAVLWLANALSAQQRSDEAFEVLQRGARIDPLHPSIASNLANELWSRGKVEQAVEVLERQLEQPNPGYGPYSVLSGMYRAMGRLVDLHALGRQHAVRLVLSHDYLAMTYALLGDLSAAQYWQERSPRDFPDYPYRRFSAAVLPAWQGDYDRAVRMFQEGLDASGIDVARHDTDVQGWFGALLARAGRHAEAIETLERVVTPEGDSGVGQWSAELEGRHALAWAYLNSGADAKADGLLSAIWRVCEQDRREGRNRHSGDLHYCAENALLRGDRDTALELLEQAVSAGWREYYLRKHDPYWAALENDPRYRALMQKAKADVDRQAVEVARVDAADNLVARVDAAVAARADRKDQRTAKPAAP
jgi:TolB-like protein/predicted Zn-dependent protease